ncbi:unnamed protein product [Vicia faba]|uniref:GH18 domain-containing protein n=1 Tax=Vicia faba TaxID=3906 RepID=A0AAV0YHL5_VICFA|nr:unnamed protein product [Vicia faba]CAI8584924.1 unnamed protein product [Vicia faba]CAI8584975.1 unnamed protein product [Vicia faba]CAI8585094.1 unnamed protein product [Vicia faba]CAI8589978.1 unnamed protein product [Vicia faba]
MTEPDIKAVVKPTIFREYIVGENINGFPSEIIGDIPKFHFILGFANDTYDDGAGTGFFKRAWNFDDFSPTKVANLKKEHKNVNVVISIGGIGAEFPFNPKDITSWTDNAVSSIKELIQDYENRLQPINNDDTIIDGIDINYEYININLSEPTQFSTCIGQVIQRLRDDPDVSKSMKVVSISPTELVNFHYLALYTNKPDNIDWINYKFYNQYFRSEYEFINFFNNLVNDYGTALKILAGFNSDTSTPTPTSQQACIDGCRILIERALLAGVFVWNANASAPTYSLEAELQKLYTKE